MSNIVLEMTAEEAKAWQAVSKIAKGMGGVEKKTNDAAKASRALKKEQDDALRLVQRYTPALDKLKQKTEALTAARKKGQITDEQYKQALRGLSSEKMRLTQREERNTQATKRGTLATRENEVATRRAGTAMRDAAASGSMLWGSQSVRFAQQLAGALGISGGVAGAVMLIRQQIMDLIETQQAIKDSALEVSDVQRTALLNLMPQSIEEGDEFIKAIEAAATKYNLEQKLLYAGASDALSARGFLSKDDAMSALVAGSRLAPHDEATAKALTGGALDVMKVQASEEGTRITPEQAIGYMQAIGTKARVTDPAKLAENVIPAYVAAKQAGASDEAAGALYAAITSGSADVQGRKSKTAMISLVGQMRDFFELQYGETLDKSLAKKDDSLKLIESPVRRAALSANVSTVEDRIAYFQSNPQAAEEFISTLSLEQAQKPVVYSLLRGKGIGAEGYAEALGSLPTFSEAGTKYSREMDVIRRMDLQQLGSLERAGKAASESASIARYDIGGFSSAMDAMSDVMTRSGVHPITRSGLALDVRSADDPWQALSNVLAHRAAQLEYNVGSVAAVDYGPGLQGLEDRGTFDRRRDVSEADQKMADAIRSLQDAVDEFRASLDKNEGTPPAVRESMAHPNEDP